VESLSSGRAQGAFKAAYSLDNTDGHIAGNDAAANIQGFIAILSRITSFGI
jgi:hypothetical protein